MLKDEASGYLENDLERLREANSEVEARCVKETVESKELKGEYKLWGKKLIGYSINEDDRLDQII